LRNNHRAGSERSGGSREAAGLPARREDDLKRTLAFVAEGLADMDTGEYEEFTDENLHELFDGVAARGRERLAAGPR
jgi:hypothetical protein